MKKGVRKSAIYRKKKVDKLLGEILYLLSVSNSLVSTHDISRELEKPWHSIQTRCLRLQVEGKVSGMRIGRMNLWKLSKMGKGEGEEDE